MYRNPPPAGPKGSKAERNTARGPALPGPKAERLEGWKAERKNSTLPVALSAFQPSSLLSQPAFPTSGATPRIPSGHGVLLESRQVAGDPARLRHRRRFHRHLLRVAKLSRPSAEGDDRRAVPDLRRHPLELQVDVLHRRGLDADREE